MRNIKFKRHLIGAEFNKETAERDTIHLVPISASPLRVKAYDIDSFGNSAEIKFDDWEPIYNDALGSKANDILKTVDKITGEDANYKLVTRWEDGSDMDDSKADGVIYIKVGTNYFKRQYQKYAKLSWWNPAGNGVVDDTVKIQKALDTVLNLDLGQDGDFYKITNKLILRDGHNLIGDRAKIKQFGNGVNLFDCSYKKDVLIKGLVLEGHGNDYQASSSSPCIGIHCFGTENLTIKDCVIFNFTYSPISGLRDMKNLLVEGCTLTSEFTKSWAASGYKKDNTGITVSGSNIVIRNNFLSNTSQGITIAEKSNKVTISGNEIKDTILEHGIYVDTGCSNISILNNNIHDVEKNGMKIQNYDPSLGETSVCENILIQGNIVTNTGIGGDAIQLSNTVGFTLNAVNVVVSNNIVSNNSQHGINVRYTKNSVVSNNTITNSLKGIYVSNNSGLIVSNNNISGCKENGIYESSSTGGNVFYKNNYLKDNGQVVSSGENGASVFISVGGTLERDLTNNTIISKNSQEYGVLIISTDISLFKFKGNSVTGSLYSPVRLLSCTNNFKYFGENILYGNTQVEYVDYVQDFPSTIYKSGNSYKASAAPVSVSLYQNGTIVYNTSPTTFVGWILSGGVWKQFGAIV